MKGEDGTYIMLEVLPDGTSRTPKVPLKDDWLEYLNFTKFGKKPEKYTFFNALCTPFMYNKYGCIFGLTGSVGGEAERKYIKETYRAVAYEVPQFLKTCKKTTKEEARNNGVTLVDSHSELIRMVIATVKTKYNEVPILVIARNPQELEEIYQRLYDELVASPQNQGRMAPEDLQRLRERNEHGVLMSDEWERVIEDATRRMGTGENTYCKVTVTEYFGGRGHDFNVMDPTTDKNGGMLVIATSIPDTREWIQWKGRTARQDRRGQYCVILSRQDESGDGGALHDEMFYAEIKKLVDTSQHDLVIKKLLDEKDKYIRATLNKFSSDQAKGAWLNELCEKYYSHPRRTLEQAKTWPSVEYRQADVNLRETLSKMFRSGQAIADHAKDSFNINLDGPPEEWNYSANMPFTDFVEVGGVGRRASAISVLFVIDVSFSMDEVEGADDLLSTQDRADQDKMVERLAAVGAELGSLTFSLMWDSKQDLDLHVIPPSGEEINYKHRSSKCGGRLDVDANFKMEDATVTPVENCYWQNAPSGDYRFYINNYGSHKEPFVVRKTLRVVKYAH
jgi:hypothetical protein